MTRLLTGNAPAAGSQKPKSKKRRGPKPTPAHVRALRKVLEDPNGCWVYQGYVAPHGYGQITLNKDEGRGRRTGYVHEVMYEHFIGPVPEGLVLDHLCRVRRCCNPMHLRSRDHGREQRRGEAPRVVLSRENRCLRGHDLTAENTYVHPKTGARRCRTCRDALRREYHVRTGK